MAFLLDDILLFPIKGPIAGFRWVMTTIQKMADEELMNDQPWKERLIELQMRLELGEIAEDEYAPQEQLDGYDAIEWLATRKFKRAVIMVQQEFANKLMASPGAHDYRAVSALAGHCFEIEVITHVASSSFSPRPAVQSAVLRLVQVRTMQEQAIKKLNWLFSKRNKRASAVSEKLGLGSSVYGEKRIDQLGADELVEMAVRANDLHAS